MNLDSYVALNSYFDEEDHYNEKELKEGAQTLLAWAVLTTVIVGSSMWVWTQWV